jgi:UDP-GlcNAc:undecaprenyl-phosphate GlcNAc-1-phosphate transferase
VLGLPLLDFAWQVFSRLRRGHNPMKGDRGHLHFRLHDHGLNQRLVVLIYYVSCAFFGILTLTLTSRLFKFVAMGVMMTLVIAGFALVSRWRQASSGSESSPSSDSGSASSSSAS